ncbi:MAG: hypothetical protein Q8P17_00480 [bacterium]|nr:hypothetical protein [bacterium]
MITADLIENRIKNFWGYGSLEASVWFIGMEERFDPSENLEMLEKQFRYAEDNMVTGMMNASRSKINLWKNLANMKPFLPHAKLQTTWKYPIALYLYLRFNSPLAGNERIEVISEHQRNTLADGDKKETTLLELSPLPCPSTKSKDWPYSGYDMEELSSREEYEKNYLQKRAWGLKELLRIHKPKLVIFYSIKYLPYWEEIIGVKPQQITRRTLFTKDKDTAFCIIPNGGRSGLSYNELYEFADKIKDHVVFRSEMVTRSGLNKI